MMTLEQERAIAIAKARMRAAQENANAAKGKPSIAESMARGGYSGATLGVGDEIQALGGAAAATMLSPEYEISNFPETYKEALGIARQSEKDARAAHPYIYGGSELAGGILTGTKAFPSAYFEAPKISGRLAQSAKAGGLLGGAAGFGYSEGGPEEVAYQTAFGGILGAGLGAGGGYVGDKYLSPLFKSGVPAVPAAIKPAVNKVAQKIKGKDFIDEAKSAAAVTEKGFPYTRGERTMAEADLAFEEEARRGLYGDKPQAIMQQARKEQEDILSGRMSGLISKDTPLGDAQDIGPIVSDKLQQIRNELKGKVSQAYAQAKASGKSAYMQRSDIMDALDNTAKAIAEEFPDEATTQAQGVINRALKKEAKDMSLQEIHNMRISLNNVSRPGEPAWAYAQKVKKTLDELMEGVVVQGLVSGDKKALDDIRKATFLRRELGKLEESVPKILLDENVTAAQAYNAILGAGRLGAKSDSVKIVKSLKGTLKEGSPEYLAIKDAGIMRLTDGVMTGTGELKLGKLASNIETAFDKNKELMQELYGADAKTIKEVGAIARKLADSTAKVRNNSNTANRLFTTLGKLSGGRLFDALEVVRQPMREAAYSRKAMSAAQGKAIDYYSPEAVRIGTLAGSRGAATND